MCLIQAETHQHSHPNLQSKHTHTHTHTHTWRLLLGSFHFLRESSIFCLSGLVLDPEKKTNTGRSLMFGSPYLQTEQAKRGGLVGRL